MSVNCRLTISGSGKSRKRTWSGKNSRRMGCSSRGILQWNVCSLKPQNKKFSFSSRVHMMFRNTFNTVTFLLLGIVDCVVLCCPQFPGSPGKFLKNALCEPRKTLEWCFLGAVENGVAMRCRKQRGFACLVCRNRHNFSHITGVCMQPHVLVFLGYFLLV